MACSVSDFDGLKVEECTFPSDSGQNTYMDVADYFTSNVYLAFAYDATGNDKSEGDSVEGLPQGVIDLDYALRYIKQSDECSGIAGEATASAAC